MFEKLDTNVIIKIAMMLDIHEILSWCISSKRFNKIICENRDFWIARLRQDYNINYLETMAIDSSKDFYRATKRIIEFVPPSTPVELGISKSKIDEAARYGNMYLIHQVINTDQVRPHNYLSAAYIAAAHNHPEAIDLFIKNLRKIMGSGSVIDITENILVGAVHGGHKELINKYLDPDNHTTNVGRVMSAAAFYGNINIIDYMYPRATLEDLYRGIDSSYNNLEIQKYIKTLIRMKEGLVRSDKFTIFNLVPEFGSK